jgi:hypothetical protein
MEMTILNNTVTATFNVEHDMITDFKLLIDGDKGLTVRGPIEFELSDKFSSYEGFIQKINEVLKGIHIPYKVSLYHDSKREINFGIIQKIIDQIINC